MINVPLAHLTVSELNLRSSADLDPDKLAILAASISSLGLLSPLTIINGNEVVAGRRRLAALRIAYADQPERLVACIEIAPADATEASLAENYAREQMTTQQLYTAFKTLAENDPDLDTGTIGAAFGYDAQRTARVLRLGRLYPPILEAWSKGTISETVAQAFASTEDQAIQQQAWEAEGNAYGYHPHTVRRMIKNLIIGEDIPDSLRRFVSIDEYVAEGGRIERDLFDDTNTTILDPDLFRSLVTAKLDAARKHIELAVLPSGVTVEWLDQEPEYYWQMQVPLTRQYANAADEERVTEVNIALEELTNEREELMFEGEDGQDCVKDPARAAEIDDTITALKDEVEIIQLRRTASLPDGTTSVRALIKVDYSGQPDVTFFYATREDAGLKPAPALEAGKKIDAYAGTPKEGLTARAVSVIKGMRQAAIGKALFDCDDDGVKQAEAHRALIFMLARSTFLSPAPKGFVHNASGNVYSNPDHSWRPELLLIDALWLQERDEIVAWQLFSSVPAADVDRIAAMVFATKVEGEVFGANRKSLPEYLSTGLATPLLARRVIELDLAFFKLFRKGQIVKMFEEAGVSATNMSRVRLWKQTEAQQKAAALFNYKGGKLPKVAELNGITKKELEALALWVPEPLRFNDLNAYKPTEPAPAKAPKTKGKKAKAIVPERELENVE